MSGKGVCGGCGKPKDHSAPVTCVLVWAPSLERPAVLIPAEKWSLCLHPTCPSLTKFVGIACSSHPETPEVGETWTHAKVLFDDGVAAALTKEQPVAQA